MINSWLPRHLKREMQARLFELVNPVIKEERLAVYTANYGGYDTPRVPRFFEGVDYFYVTDNAAMDCRGWQKVVCPKIQAPRLESKLCKILSFNTSLFSDYAYTLWVDANVLPRTNPLAVAQKYLEADDMAFYKHHERADFFDEFDAVVAQGKERKEIVLGQQKKYAGEGCPLDLTLHESTIIFRKTKSEKVAKVMNRWAEEIRSGSLRDQLSFDYCCWKEDYYPKTIDGNVFTHYFFDREEHRRMV